MQSYLHVFVMVGTAAAVSIVVASICDRVLFLVLFTTPFDVHALM